jgi:hypothetical protein
MANWANIFPIGLILFACLIALIGDNWRNVLIAMAVMYFGAFFLYLGHWPFTMAAAKLITGWMCVATLSFVTAYQEVTVEAGTMPKRIFKAMALVMIWVVAYLMAAKVGKLFQVSPEIAFATFAVLGGGLLQLGMSSMPFKVVIGILTFFAGFELLYSGLEASILINGLILAVNLLIAFVGSYLVMTTKPGGNV